MKQEVNVVDTKQLAIPEIGRPEKTAYHLVIGENDDRVIINIGETTFNKVKDLITKKPKKQQ